MGIHHEHLAAIDVEDYLEQSTLLVGANHPVMSVGFHDHRITGKKAASIFATLEIDVFVEVIVHASETAEFRNLIHSAAAFSQSIHFLDADDIRPELFDHFGGAGDVHLVIQSA